LNTGITVVGKQSIVPRGARLGRNVKIGGGVKSSDYATRVVRAGGSVEPSPAPRSRGRAGTDAEREAASAV